MAGWEFLSVDLASREVVGEVRLDTATFTRTRDPVGGFSASMALLAADPDDVAPLQLIAAVREDVPVADGLLWDPHLDDSDPSNLTPQVALEGAGVASYLDRRLLRETRVYDDVDVALILSDLYGWAQGRGSLAYGATVGTPRGVFGVDESVAPVGVTATWRWDGFRRQWLGDAAAQVIADNVVGYHLELIERDGLFVHRLRVRTTYEHRGALVYGDNVDGFRYGRVGSDIGTDVDAVGAGEGEDMIAATASDPLAPFPQVDRIVTDKGLERDDQVAALAAAELNRSRRAPGVLSVRVARDQIAGWLDALPRETVDVTVTRGWAQVVAERREISEVQLVVTDGAEELWLVTEPPEDD